MEITGKWLSLFSKGSQNLPESGENDWHWFIVKFHSVDPATDTYGMQLQYEFQHPVVSNDGPCHADSE